MKKLGRILLCILPLLVYIGVQIVGALFGSFGAGIIVGVEAATQGYVDNMALIAQRSQEIYMEIYPILLCGIHVIAIIVGLVWVYLLFGKKKPGNPVKAFSWLTIPVLILCAIGIQYACSNALSLVNIVKPSWMESYIQMMETAGFTELSLGIILATVCLAPIGEELLFRGVTLRLAKNAGVNFWVANVIQALCFGIAHLNVVQGIYAFAMGLIIGYIYEKYNSLYVPILLHALINLLGTVVSTVLNLMLPENLDEPGIGACAAGLVVFLIVLAAGLLLMKKDKKTQQLAEVKGEDGYATV